MEKFDFMLSMGVDCSVEMPHSRWAIHGNPISHSKDLTDLTGSLIFNVGIRICKGLQRYGHIAKSAWDPSVERSQVGRG